MGYLPDTKIQTYPRIVHRLAKEYIIDIAAGASHCLALTDKGQVYSWGHTTFDLLGYSIFRDENEALLPTLVPGLPTDIVSIACGSYHSFAVDKYGQLFAWGWNHYQQCGLVEKVSDVVPKNRICQPTLVPYFAVHGVKHEDDTSVYGVSFTEALRKELGDYFSTSRARSKIKCVSAGESHTVVLMDDNSLVVFGRCDEGQLGLILYSNYQYTGAFQTDEGDINSIGYPMKHLWRCKQEITEVVCGDNHTLLLTQEGDMYGFGHSADCQLGLYIHQVVVLPTLVESMQGKKVIHASAGDRFSLFVVAA